MKLDSGQIIRIIRGQPRHRLAWYWFRRVVLRRTTLAPGHARILSTVTTTLPTAEGKVFMLLELERAQ